MRRWHLATLVLFTLVLVAPLGARAVGARAALDENSAPARPPALRGLAVLEQSALAQLRSWSAEQVGLRAAGVEVERAVLASLDSGPASPDVTPGRDGWLFSRDELVAACRLDEPVERAMLEHRLDETHWLADLAGVELRVAIAPDKAALATEQLSPVPRPLRDCVRAAHEGVLELEDRGVVLPHRRAVGERTAAGMKTYFRTDTHWTHAGGLPLAASVVRAFDPTVWDSGRLEPAPPATITTDLTRLLGSPEQEQGPRVRPVADVDVERTTPDRWPRGRIHFSTSGDVPLLPGRTVLLHDSFAWAPMGPIAAHTEQLVAVKTPDPATPVALDAVRSADRLVYEVVQRAAARAVVDEDLPARLAMALAPRLPFSTPTDAALQATDADQVLVAIDLPALPPGPVQVDIGEHTVDVEAVAALPVGPDVPLVVRAPATAAAGPVHVAVGRHRIDVRGVTVLPLPSAQDALR